jgi:hypothetical protein
MILDHVTEIRKTVLSQYRGSRLFMSILHVLGSMCDDIELVFLQLGKLLDIDAMGGANLDRIAWLVGCTRYLPSMVLLDPDLRRLIRLRIRRNMAKGHLEDMIVALREFVGLDGVWVVNDVHALAPGMSISFALPRELTDVEQAMLDADVWPRTIGVALGAREMYIPNGYFGFDDQPGALGFGPEDDGDTFTGGVFAEEF